MAMANGEDATIELSGIGTELSDAILMNMYRTYGPIVRVRHNGSNSAYVSIGRLERVAVAVLLLSDHVVCKCSQVVFERNQHALNAVEATNGAVVYGKTLKVKLQHTFKKVSRPCRGFAAGICRKGDMCKYLHVTDDAAFAPTAADTKAPKAPREKKKKTPRPAEPAKDAEPRAVPPEVKAIPENNVCRHFSRGYCAQGSACKFAHVLGLPKPDAPTGKVAQLCQFYESGLCTRGDACRFIHVPKAAATPAKTAAAKDSAESDSDEESKRADEQNEENRTCVECEKPGVAVWQCAKCDNSLYCDDCNSAVHRARVMAKHKRSKLPPVPKLPSCGECESKIASVQCEQCEVALCASCDASVHKFKSLRKHTRVKLSTNVEKAKSKAKEPREDKKKKEDKKPQVTKSAPQPRIQDPVQYVESVPQLDFSSESESSDSEDEKMPEALPAKRDDDKPMPAANNSSESEEDFDDVKPQSSVPITTTPVVQEEASESSEPDSDDDLDDMPATKPTPPRASVPKMELSSDSSDSSDDEFSNSTPAPTSAPKAAVPSDSEDKSEDEATTTPASKPLPASKPTLAEMSSESESDSDDEASSKPAAKSKSIPAPKPVVKKASSSSSESGSDSTDDSDDEASSKPATKAKAAPAPKPMAKKSSSSSSSESSDSDSSDSSEDEAPPAKPAAKPTPAPRRVPARSNKAGGISEGSSHTLVKKIEAFSESSEGGELHLDANLNGFERLLAHDCAERLGLAHESTGEGLERHIIISRAGVKRPAADSGNGQKAKKSRHHR
ncbi:unnamed protein product [Phytophthora fragariaefolia]|uniref:Unnamed protein product n=1 Tax=Phytophthora fragariaefolia TaxID=1490495 RepID=A0A9W6XW39_9STRA|nr:unnamed protein product [Phytophthora fragariaefolia]